MIDSQGEDSTFPLIAKLKIDFVDLLRETHLASRLLYLVV